ARKRRKRIGAVLLSTRFLAAFFAFSLFRVFASSLCRRSGVEEFTVFRKGGTDRAGRGLLLRNSCHEVSTCRLIYLSPIGCAARRRATSGHSSNCFNSTIGGSSTRSSR